MVRNPRHRALALVLVVSGSACASLAPLTRAQFLDEADQICAKAQQDLQSVVTEFPEEVAIDTLPGFAQGYERVIPILREEFDALRSLAPPPDNEEGVTRLVDAQRDNIDAVEDARGAALKADIDGFSRAFERAASAAKEFREAAAGLGLRVCGRPVTASSGEPSPNTSRDQELLAEAPAAASAAGCSDVLTVEPYGSVQEDRAHADPIPPLATYPSTPPTSGPHAPTPLPAGVYQEPPPVGNLIHSLEHGAVVVWYDPSAVATSDLNEVSAFFREPAHADHVIVAPYSYPEEGQPGRLPTGTMALVAWHRMQTCERVVLPVVFAFVVAFRPDPASPERYLGEAPEPGAPI